MYPSTWYIKENINSQWFKTHPRFHCILKLYNPFISHFHLFFNLHVIELFHFKLAKYAILVNLSRSKICSLKNFDRHTHILQGLLWSWSYGSWIYNYLCNQCLSPIMLWVRITLRQGVLNITLCDKVWFSLVSSTNKTEILLKVTLNTITLTSIYYIPF